MNAGDRLAGEAVRRAFEVIDREPRRGIWIELVDRRVVLDAATAVDGALADGRAMPLAGTTFAVKDNIDVAGVPTTAACPAFAYTPSQHATAVAALVEQGAVVIGKTNLDQFATGLVGTRSPYGICPNAHWPHLVSGGSSSGSAVAVAAGHVDFALGTDTAGSGRIPAACNGIIGIKPTRGGVSAAGVVPACRSLDCVTVFARSVELAASVAAHLAATAPDAADPWSRRRPVRGETSARTSLRLGVPVLGVDDFDGDPHGPRRFGAAAALLASAAQAATTEIDLAPFVQAGALLYDGTFVAERFDAVGEFVATHLDEVEPVVAKIVMASAGLPAWQVFRDRTTLHRLAQAATPTWDLVDVLVVPSAPRIPTVAEVLAAPIERNTMLGRYTNFVNLLDLCALTMPVPTPFDLPDAPPMSITLIAPAWCDALLVSVAERAQRGTSAIHRTP